jgi:sec-independent protein translocase protein TatA
MPQLGPLEIAVVLLIALLVFGPNRLPELARQMGGALRELKKIQANLRADLHEMMTDESDGAAPPPTLPPKDAVGLPPGDVPTSGSGEDAAPAPPTAVAPPPPPDVD